MSDDDDTRAEKVSLCPAMDCLLVVDAGVEHDIPSSSSPPQNFPEDFGGEEDVQPGSLVMSLLIPVSATMVLVVLLIAEMRHATQQVEGTFSQLMVYQEKDSDTSVTILGGVLLNGLVLVALLFVVTTCLLALYKFRCYVLIYAWLFMSVASLLGGFGGFVAQQLLQVHDVLFDVGSFLFCLYNFACGGTLLVFWTEYGLGNNPPLLLQQAYLVIISALLAWSTTKTPEWSTWGLLGGAPSLFAHDQPPLRSPGVFGVSLALSAVAIWDLIAVLTPQGPLKLLVEEAERRNESIPGLVYQSVRAHAELPTCLLRRGCRSNRDCPPHWVAKSQAHHIKLGLGDFVFYSVLVGRASMHGSAPLWLCAIAVLAGLCATLALLPILQRVLPALPISVAVGIGFYFVSAMSLSPLAHAASGFVAFL